MTRMTFPAALAVCALAACSDDASEPESAPARAAEEPNIARLVIQPPPEKAKPTTDEGHFGKKDAPRRSAHAAPKGDPNAPVTSKGFTGGAALFGGGVGTASGMGGLGLRGAAKGGGGYGSGVGALGPIGGRGRGAVVVGAFSGHAGGTGAGLGEAPAEAVGSFQHTGVNPFVTAAEDRLSTFAADVDTASYTLSRRVLLGGHLPPRDAVRVEEFLNYFRYDDPAPKDRPLSATLEVAPSPYAAGRHLLRIGLKGRQVDVGERKPAHLTFLVDVSGSMSGPDRLPLAKRALRMLVDQLRDGDTVALVTYAGHVKLALPHTGLEHKARIHQAIEELDAGGGTGMASGIQLAYEQAARKLDSQSISRVVILSDGDANIGPSTPDALLDLIRGHAKEGVTVTTVGFGMGNYRGGLMEKFADAGNGNHYYVDSLFAARRVFAEELGGTLEVIAQDVKLQVEFDPAQVKRYRLVGYENRDVADRDFRNDKVDGGEVGSGHRVTAVYELELAGEPREGLATLRVRAKKPRGVEASEWKYGLAAHAVRTSFDAASADLRFAAAVVGAAELFRQSPHAQGWKLDDVLRVAQRSAGDRPERLEFVELLRKAKGIDTLAMR